MHFLTFALSSPSNTVLPTAACEDPTTISSFDYGTNTWPLPQTGQMWLEYDLLTNPEEKGFFCVTTSYRYVLCDSVIVFLTP